MKFLIATYLNYFSAKQLDGALAEEALKRHEAKRIRITGKAGVNEREAAHLIIQEAQNFIQQELGISGIHWKHKAARKLEKTSESNILDQSISSAVGTNPQAKVKRTVDDSGSTQKRPKSSEIPAVVNTVLKQATSSNELKTKGNILGISESNVPEQSTSSAIGAYPLSKFKQTIDADGSAHKRPNSSAIQPNLESKQAMSSCESNSKRSLNESNRKRSSNESNRKKSSNRSNKKRISNESSRNKNSNENSEEAPNLENYPEILRQMYTETKSTSRGLSVQKEIVCGKSSGELLNDTFQETCEVGEEESVAFSGSILNDNVNLVSENEDVIEDLDKNCSLNPMNKTSLLVEDIKENLDNTNAARNGYNTVINESFYANFDEKFCSFQDTQKTCSKLENERGLREEVDNVSYNELLLSQTANADYVYFTESFSACPNDSSNKENVHDYVLPSAIEHTTKAIDCVLPYYNNDMDSQCMSSVKKSDNRCSFLDASDVFISESRFSFELQNSLKLHDYFPENISTPINEIKLKAEQSLLASNSTNNNFNQKQVAFSHFEEKSSLKTDVIPSKMPNNDLFSAVKHSEILLPVLSKSDTYVSNLRTGSPKVKISLESPLKFEKGNSINETSGDIFEFEESFNADCLDSGKANKTVLSDTKTKDSFNADVIKTENLAAETSGDIFEDSFEDHIVQLEIEANKHSNRNIPANEKIRDTLKNYNYDIVKKQIVNISAKKFDTKHIPYSNAADNKNHRKEELSNIKKDYNSIKHTQTEIVVLNTSLKESDVPLLNTKDQSQFWNSWNPSQESFLTRPPAQKSKNNGTIKCLPDVLIEKTGKLNEDGDLTLDSADNSLFNSFNSDCLSPTPDKSSKSLHKIQISSRRISSGFLAIPESKKSARTCKKNKELINKENILPNNKEKTNSQHFRVDSQIKLKISEISDAELVAFLKRTAKVNKFALSVACEKMLTKHRKIGPSKSEYRFELSILLNNTKFTKY